ncbi:MAG: peptide-methionine (R)-S-oxide reductase MsrB [Halopseudomonas sabulinigri]
MKRRTLLTGLLAVPAIPLLARSPLALAVDKEMALTVTPLDNEESYWRDKVSAEAYDVLFEEDTERPHSSPLDKLYDDGTYVCAACYSPLFNASAKFDSGTGWPSFTQPIEGHLGSKADYAFIWPRTEYHCGRCGGHQGHLFDDGPAPRGERWCNNGLALRFVPKGEKLPALRGDA